MLTRGCPRLSTHAGETASTHIVQALFLLKGPMACSCAAACMPHIHMGPPIPRPPPHNSAPTGDFEWGHAATQLLVAVRATAGFAAQTAVLVRANCSVLVRAMVGWALLAPPDVTPVCASSEPRHVHTGGE